MVIVNSVSQVIGTADEISGTGWRSRRLLTADKGRPYSLHETTLDAGAALRFCYEVHSETVYCVSGSGRVEDLDSGVRSRIQPGTMYAVAPGDDHAITADTDMKLVCVFNPPLAGDESAR